jgi:ribonuclease R
MDNKEIITKVSQIVNSNNYKPLIINKLALTLGLPVKEWTNFFKQLKKMEADGIIVITEANRVKNVKQSGLVSAVLLSITKTGGFAARTDKSGDVFIQRANLNGAMPTDEITLKLVKSGGRLPEAIVIKISKKNFSEFTGIFHKLGKNGYISADAGIKEKIPVIGQNKIVHDNDKVLARIKNGSGEIISTFGPSTSAVSCCKAVLSRYKVRLDFPLEVVEQAKTAMSLIENTQDRLDLRDKIIFTIDGETAKDLDDAISVEKTDGGYLLGVHIADVSHYVTEGSPLDKEAFKRGTSIYYANSVIPMLPKELSNGICSLTPGEDRLVFSAFITLDEQGKIKGYELKKSIIRSKVKGVYEEVNKIFDGSADEDILKKYSVVMPVLMLAREVSAKMTLLRMQRGALDIESDDCKILIGNDGIVTDIIRRSQGQSEMLVEEFMLCANEAVATYAKNLEMPLVYRVHGEPEAKKIDNLIAVLKVLGIDTKSIHIGLTPADLSAVNKKLKDLGKGSVLSNIILRAMAKARYSPICTGHFGLALENYCHFTSPIRRYPDLAVHRILSDVLKNGAGDDIVNHYKEFAAEASRLSTDNEITAMRVEWDCEAIYKAEYMVSHIGEKFDGVISSVQSYGFYVELDNTVEGMCRIETIQGGWFEYDEKRLAIVNPQNNASYVLGDKVSVIVTRAEVSTGQIDFELAKQDAH